MANYVQYFLSCIRADFPNIIVDYELGGPDSLASTKRIAGGWDGNLSKYLPKFAVGIHFNHGLVHLYLQADLEQQLIFNLASHRYGEGS